MTKNLSVSDTVRIYMLKGMSKQQAIEEVELILRAKLPDNIKSLIEVEVKEVK